MGGFFDFLRWTLGWLSSRPHTAPALHPVKTFAVTNPARTFAVTTE